MKRLFDVISEKDLASLIYEEELTYKEATEKINKYHDVNFHPSTIGRNWREIRTEWIITANKSANKSRWERVKNKLIKLKNIITRK